MIWNRVWSDDYTFLNNFKTARSTFLSSSYYSSDFEYEEVMIKAISAAVDAKTSHIESGLELLSKDVENLSLYGTKAAEDAISSLAERIKFLHEQIDNMKMEDIKKEVVETVSKMIFEKIESKKKEDLEGFLKDLGDL